MGKCKSCGADIIWIKLKSGKVMPCDPQKIPFRVMVPGTKGSLTLVCPDGRVASGDYDPTSDMYGYQSHFATCPAAREFRRRE